MLQQTTTIQKEIKKLREQFLHSSDFTVKEITWCSGEVAIFCFYSSLVKKSEVESNLNLLRLAKKTLSYENPKTRIDEPIGNRTTTFDDSVTITTEPYNNEKLIDYICNGETLVILLHTQEMIRLESPDFVHRTPDEPENEHILRGSHEGLVENFDSNVSLIRKRIKNT